MRKKKMNKIWWKVILPLSIVGLMIGILLLHKGNITSEVGVKYMSTPWTSEGCKVDEKDKK